MTTTVKVHVGGNYRATVKQDDMEPATVGPDEEKSFYLAHPAHSRFEITEEYLGAATETAPASEPEPEPTSEPADAEETSETDTPTAA